MHTEDRVRQLGGKPWPQLETPNPQGLRCQLGALIDVERDGNAEASTSLRGLLRLESSAIKKSTDEAKRYL